MTRALGKSPAVLDHRVLPLRAVMDKGTPPADCNWYATMGSWPMLANDTVGCCVEAAALHAIQQRRAYALADPWLPNDDTAIQLYGAWAGYKPGDVATDKGTIMSAAMTSWATAGVPVGGNVDTLASYATVEHLSSGWMRSAIYHCGSVLLGIACPTRWLSVDYLFDLQDGDLADIAGGHAVLLVGYEATALGTEYDCVTWGMRARLTEAALLHVADEAYAILDRDFFDARGVAPDGVDWAAAQAAVEGLKG